MDNNSNKTATDQPTFYWHDYETFGLSPSLDRPSQFAGIRTDMDFNVIGEPDMFYCRQSDDYLPSPEAAMITGITPQKTQAEGVSEAEFSKRIEAQFSLKNTCIIGYNNIRFDDEVTRNIFYRNFYDPYAHTWKDGNSRWDIIDLMRACYALRPEGIVWPENDDGLPSMRLELLTKANGIEHANAHDATSDVYATIAMAKLVKEKQPKLFDFLFNLRSKRKVESLIDIINMTPLVHVSGMFGADRGFTSWVVPLAWHPTNNNAVIVADLAQDITPLLELSADELRERLYTPKKDLGDLAPIPLKLIHINKCPVLAPAKTLLPENAERLGIDRNACLANLKRLKESATLRENVVGVYQVEREYPKSNNVDSMIYDGFFSAGDKANFEILRETAPEQLAGLQLKIGDARFNELFFRYRARNFPHLLSMPEQQKWLNHCRTVLEDAAPAYFARLDALAIENSHDERKMKLLQQLYLYGQTIIGA
ncbi:Exodeoxyribonuclease I [Moritella sp. JT01]|uniref:exodeoxyribonuclease I n=1 Tax=Moritella sp. JT01 TaxID=756698 RepID=UPI0007937EB2|nr:exodeoxyribonuclease I [Moritella sp. JT01]KXO10155.1 Exodeoxyribonuclease I [Moritella sp. JT01]